MEKNKPLDSDGVETSVENTEIEKPGGEDVEAAFLQKVSEISGRTFGSIEDYQKHYKELSSYVGKKVEVEKKDSEEDIPVSNDAINGIKELNERFTKMEFFTKNPEAEKHFDEFVKPLADGKGLSYQEAWDKIQPLIKSSETLENEREIGVSSKNRIQNTTQAELQKISSDARKGDPVAQDEFTKKVLLKKFGF